MRKAYITILILSILLGLLGNTGCKTSEDIAEFTLTVTLQDGAIGTPATGIYTYDENDEVTYDYSLETGFTRLIVVLDGVEVESSGTITMGSDHVLDVYASEGTGEFQLSVSFGTGVTGNPESGYYFYDSGEQVNYSYSAEAGYTNLVVKLDGEDAPAAGTITFSQDHSLFIYASKEFYIQGSWTLKEVYEDGSSFEVTVTFSGETRTGTVVDSDGGIGTYTVNANSVQFTIEYPEVTYEYSGYFTDEVTMSGEARRYYTLENTYKRGSWAASKDSS